MATQGETHAKRISNEIISERLEAFRSFLAVDENRKEFVEEISVVASEFAHRIAPDVTKAFASEVAATMIPYDVFSIADYLLNYNFQPTAKLLGDSLHSISQTFMKIPRYQNGAQVVSAIAAVVDIVATVEPLSTSTEPASSDNYSLLGQTILNLPQVITNSLDQQVWQQAAADCAVLTNRLYFTDFVGSYNSPYGTVEFNYNAGVKPVFSNIYDICLALSVAPEVSE
eukprot:CAMPEP_0117009428 /NCGR_PEP_ID=MMETSP0472-20121206/8569_1 /TAXON_ID=693140 ORGANISM="Tiarina fusus, Strain LIS" /NCGR_SAMPLE_ID=MMETSP0472 /ASSEMBLY_ACC=CAM_ASM_000603 /LENGTH=227 /DNA_ID=CAMNT_0004711709 /DNA_START=139 /DNA_END=822 /DNA_ORIENTATION=-